MARLDLSVDPQKEFERKRMEAHQAARLVESGDLVWMPSAHQPPAILATLAAREQELRDVTIRSVVISDMGWFRESACRMCHGGCGALLHLEKAEAPEA